MALDPMTVRSLQTICLRLERLVSGAVAKHGRASEQSLALLSLAIKDNADHDDLVSITESCISRIEVDVAIVLAGFCLSFVHSCSS